MFKIIDKNQREFILSGLEERFGLGQSLFEHFLFFEATKGRVFITSKIPHEALGYYIQTLGQLFCRLDATVKPSTNMIQIFGKHATKNVLELEKTDAQKAITGFDLEIKESNCSDGYVILKYKNFFLGCGLLKNGQVKNMIPKAKRIRVDLL